ncbi:MAG TPA: hypothetical protein ENO21_00510 [Firmicutes bacterium]|nr:hypothetical protein [Bacillota bacterium]
MERDGDNRDKPDGGLLAALRRAFAIEAYDESSLTAEERTALDNLANSINRRRMTAPAIMFIESHRHMNFLSSQLMVMAEPVADLASPVLNPVLQRFGMHLPLKELPVLQAALEKRYSIEYLIQRLEHYAAVDPAGSGTDAAEAPPADPDDPPAGAGD